MNQRIVIAINREYGSGGRTIGNMLAENLGIHYYDKEILKLASDESGISENLFNKANDKDRSSLLHHIARSVYTGELISPESRDFTSDKNLFNYQAKIIKRLAETESCVIVGRCAGSILKNYPNVVRVFVHAPSYYLLERAAEMQSMPIRELEKYVEKENKRMAAYNDYYAGEKWDDAHNYDICLDSSKLGFEKCLELIKSYMRVRFDGLDI